MMIDLQSTVITATSSYALLLAEEINRRGLKDKNQLKKRCIRFLNVGVTNEGNPFVKALVLNYMILWSYGNLRTGYWYYL